MKWIYTLCRFTASFLIIFYGFAKLNGSQFTILDSELDKPMGQVSGFWLTWYYFGYSWFYGNFIGLAQIIGAVMLMFRRTTLLGSCLLFPIIGNIILVDIFYRISPDALLVAVLIEFALACILIIHREELLAVFWRKQNALFPATPTSRSITIGKHAVRASIIIFAAAFTYWVANYNNRLPTPIDGVWKVADVSPDLEGATDIPSVFFFERNRAYMCVIKTRDGSYATHHFEINPETHSVEIWRVWLRKGEKLLAGSYDLSGNRIQLKGKWRNRPEEIAISLER